jgi:hypothetical protein
MLLDAMDLDSLLFSLEGSLTADDTPSSYSGQQRD